MKRYLLLTFFLFGIQSQCNAYCEDTDCSDSAPCVNLYCPSYNFEFKCRPLCLQPSSHNLNYAVEVITLPAIAPTWKVHSIQPSYHFGFDVGAAYVFDCRATLITANWEHFQSKDTNTTQTGTDDFVGPLFDVGPDSTPYKNARGRVRFRYDMINLNYGILLKFCHSLKANLFTGLSTVWLKQSLHTQFSNSDSTIVRKIQVPSRFTGIGPQIGLDLSYNLFKGFSLNVQSSAGILVGTLKNHSHFEATSPILDLINAASPNLQNTHVRNTNQVVPTVNGRIGVNYACEFYDSTVEFGAGYESRVFFDAIQSVDINSELVRPPLSPNTIGVFARTFHKTLSNFALSGPYLTFNIGFKF